MFAKRVSGYHVALALRGNQKKNSGLFELATLLRMEPAIQAGYSIPLGLPIQASYFML